MKCPYCDGKGLITGTEADPAGKKVYAVNHGCHKCGGEGTGNPADPESIKRVRKGTGQIAVGDSASAELSPGDTVNLALSVINLHPTYSRATGQQDGCNLELGRAMPDGTVQHFLTIEDKAVTKASPKPAPAKK